MIQRTHSEDAKWLDKCDLGHYHHYGMSDGSCILDNEGNMKPRSGGSAFRMYNNTAYAKLGCECDCHSEIVGKINGICSHCENI